MLHLFRDIGLDWGVIVAFVDPWVIDKNIKGGSLERITD
jgi:hypothetical protein